MNPLIFTCYNHLIDPKIVEYQKAVINKFDCGIPFKAHKYDFLLGEWGHGDLLNKAISDFLYYRGYDALLILDVDAIPLSSEAVLTTFELAYEGNLVGNIQRANHLPSVGTYVAPSFMCFTRDTLELAGNPSMSETSRTDVAGIFTKSCERFNIPTVRYLPTHSEAPALDTGEYWYLGEGLPTYGHGTTFSHNGKPMSYHLFNSARATFNDNFYRKCEDILK